MKKMLVVTLSAMFVMFGAFALFAGSTATISGVLESQQQSSGGNYYYIQLNQNYNDPTSLESLVEQEYPTTNDDGIYYNGNFFKFDSNQLGPHITITQANIGNGANIDSLVGEQFSFTYQLNDQNYPVVLYFPPYNGGSKAWLVVPVQPTAQDGGYILNPQSAILHSSVGYMYTD